MLPFIFVCMFSSFSFSCPSSCLLLLACWQEGPPKSWLFFKKSSVDISRGHQSLYRLKEQFTLAFSWTWTLHLFIPRRSPVVWWFHCLNTPSVIWHPDQQINPEADNSWIWELASYGPPEHFPERWSDRIIWWICGLSLFTYLCLCSMLSKHKQSWKNSVKVQYDWLWSSSQGVSDGDSEILNSPGAINFNSWCLASLRCKKNGQIPSAVDAWSGSWEVATNIRNFWFWCNV